MKIAKILKYLGVATITMGLAVGCASQQKQPEPTQPEVKKPSAAAEAIAAAKDAIKKAKAIHWEWRDTGKMLKHAEKALKEGDEAKATKLANKARSQAELAVKQYYYEQGVDRSLPPMEGVNAYTVNKGDSLWRIAGKSEIYNNPYQWPLIYKANSAKIKDADLIYPGQEFSINNSASEAEINAAVKHAKTRGAWSIGKVEESDKAYLAK